MQCLGEGVCRPVIGAIAIACAELALRCDITVLESLEEGCMHIRVEVRCDGSIGGKKGCLHDSEGIEGLYWRNSVQAMQERCIPLVGFHA